MSDVGRGNQAGMRVLLVLVAVLLAGLWLKSRQTEPVAQPAGNRAETVLSYGLGRGDETSDAFEVPLWCPRQEIVYGGDVIDSDVDVAFVNFRAIDRNGRGVESHGPADLLNAGDGSGVWSLPAGSYMIEISSYNASWRYRLVCR